MFVILMVVIAAMEFIGMKLWEMVSAATFITLKCAILTKVIVVTPLELLMGYVMTQTIIEFAIMTEETAALD